jgi:hypothetical protein
MQYFFPLTWCGAGVYKLDISPIEDISITHVWTWYSMSVHN